MEFIDPISAIDWLSNVNILLQRLGAFFSRNSINISKKYTVLFLLAFLEMLARIISANAYSNSVEKVPSTNAYIRRIPFTFSSKSSRCLVPITSLRFVISEVKIIAFPPL